MSEQAPLLRVCSLLNNYGAKYLIPEDLENHMRVIAALSELEDHAAAELTPQDLVENAVVKIADEVEVDVSTRAWKISYVAAIGTSLKATIEGGKVPYVDLQTLIKSKSPEREQDKVDVQRLLSLNQRE
jgi:hypothetical protein